MSDLKENLHTEHMVLNMGPSHPATHGTVKFLLTLDGETIVNCVVDVGYLHRGFEKMCESVSWTNVFPYTTPGVVRSVTATGTSRKSVSD